MIKKLSAEDLRTLKEPFGTLIPDAEVTKERINQILTLAEKIISVGDATTERIISFGIIPHIAVIDGIERRFRREYPSSYEAAELHCINPSGIISKEAISVIRTALSLAPP